MALVTTTQLTNAATDTQTLSDVVNGAASPGTLTSRLGRSLSTVAKVLADINTALTAAIAAFNAALPSWTGAWSSATAYTVGKCVSYGGSSYVAIQAGTNHLPTDTAYWTLLAQTGDVSQARTQNNTWTGTNTFQGTTTFADGPIRGYLGYNVGTSTLVSGSLSPGTTVSRTAAGMYRVTNSRITAESVCVASPSITGAVTVSTSAASGHAQLTLESNAGSNFDGDLHISFIVYP